MLQQASMTWMEVLHWTWPMLSFELFELEGFPITLGKLISGLLLIPLSFIVSKYLARWIDQRVLGRLNMDESLHDTFRSLLYYFLLLLTVLFTLRLLHVPLTVFTVIGGALAVGVGFGSQNLVNNFISGLLVMFERPIRVGDYIEVNGITGRVQSIGIRSTKVRTLANALIVIPNTTMIANHLTNWTLSGVIWTSIRLAVPYAFDPEQVRRVCLAAAAEIDGVLEDPGPGLSFAEFGEKAMQFDLSFALPSHAFAGRGRAQSEMRYAVQKRLKEAGSPLQGF